MFGQGVKYVDVQMQVLPRLALPLLRLRSCVACAGLGARGRNNDIGISEILSPSSGANLSATEQVTVVVTNYGGATQSNFDVSYQLDSGDIITENVAGPLEGNSSIEYTFTQTVDVSIFGTYTITVYTSLDGDSDTSNDSSTSDLSLIHI